MGYASLTHPTEVLYLIAPSYLAKIHPLERLIDPVRGITPCPIDPNLPNFIPH
jgi:hypothetical protein